jgi:hypothetical protein
MTFASHADTIRTAMCRVAANVPLPICETVLAALQTSQRTGLIDVERWRVVARSAIAGCVAAEAGNPATSAEHVAARIAADVAGASPTICGE